MSRTMSSVNEYYETLPQRFQAPASKGVEAVFQWNIGGEGGRTFYAAVTNGDLKIEDGTHASPSVTLEADADNDLKVINGEMNGMMAVMKRKMKVGGNIKLAKKMQQIFPIEFA